MTLSAQRRRSLSRSSSTSNRSKSSGRSKRANRTTSKETAKSIKRKPGMETSSEKLDLGRTGAERDGNAVSSYESVKSKEAEDPETDAKPAYCPCSCHDDEDDMRTLYNFDMSTSPVKWETVILVILVVPWCAVFLWYFLSILFGRKDPLFDEFIDEKQHWFF